jgi:hypothetical protein
LNVLWEQYTVCSSDFVWQDVSYYIKIIPFHPQQNNWFSAHIILRYTSGKCVCEKWSVLSIIGLILKTNIGKWEQKIVHQLIAILSSHHYAYW